MIIWKYIKYNQNCFIKCLVLKEKIIPEMEFQKKKEEKAHIPVRSFH